MLYEVTCTDYREAQRAITQAERRGSILALTRRCQMATAHHKLTACPLPAAIGGPTSSSRPSRGVYGEAGRRVYSVVAAPGVQCSLGLLCAGWWCARVCVQCARRCRLLPLERGHAQRGGGVNEAGVTTVSSDSRTATLAAPGGILGETVYLPRGRAPLPGASHSKISTDQSPPFGFGWKRRGLIILNAAIISAELPDATSRSLADRPVSPAAQPVPYSCHHACAAQPIEPCKAEP